MAKQQRLTQKLNLALSRASAAASIGKDNPDLASKACKEADAALDEAMVVLGEIMRAAEAI